MALTPLPCAGQEADFSAGFEKLKALGLPDLAGAKWVRETSSGRWPVQGYSAYMMQQLMQNTAGNAWLLPDGKQVIGMGEITPRKPQGVTTKSAGGGFLSALGNAFSGKSSNVDPVSDAKAILNGLNGNEMTNSSFASAREDPQVLARLIIFAAQLHTAGHKEQANKLAAAVFALPTEPSRVIDSAISVLAGEQCRAALDTFYKSGDWKTLAAKLNEITARYPRGWPRREAIATLAAKISAQAAKGPTAPPAPLEPSPPALSKAVLEWLTAGETSEAEKPEAEMEEVESEGEEEDSENITLWTLSAEEASPAFLKEGLKMLPVLIPLLTDRTLTSRPQEVAGPAQREMDFSFDSSAIPELPDSFTLPATRANLVAPLLRQVIPNGSELDPAGLHIAATAFWKDHAKTPPVALAAVYLQEGDETQQTLAAGWLSQTDAAGADEAFTVWALDPDELVNRLDTSKEFIRNRREAAAPFLVKLAAALRSKAAKPDAAPAEPTPMNFGDNEDRKPALSTELAEGIIRSLEMLTSSKGLEDTLMKVGAAKEPAGPVLNAMRDDLYGGSIEKVMPALLKAAVAATPENRPEFINTAQQLIFRYSRYSDDEVIKLPDMSGALREPLLALLENTESIPQSRRDQYETLTIGDSAAALDTLLHDFKSFRKMEQLHTLTGEPVMDFLRRRSIARLKKETLPDWPSGDNVKPERLKEIATSLTGKSPAEIIIALQPLTLEERAAFVEWLKDPEDPPLPDSIKAMRGVIHSVSPFSQYGAASFGSKTPELAPSIGFAPGTALSADFFAERAKALLTKAKDSPPLVTFFNIPGKLTLGLDLVAAEADPAAKESKGNDIQETPDGKVPLADLQHYFSHSAGIFTADDKTTAIATLWFYSENNQSLTHWLLQPDGTITSKSSDGEGEEGKSATEALTKLLAAEKPPGSATIIFTVIHRSQAKIFEEARPRY